MSDEQQLLNEPYRITWQGKEIKIGLIDSGVCAAFVGIYKPVAVQEFKELMLLKYGEKPEGEAKSELAAEWATFRDDWIKGRLKWGGDLAKGWIGQHDGAKALLSCMLEAGGTPLGADDIASLLLDPDAQVGTLLATAVWDCENPKAKRPTAKK